MNKKRAPGSPPAPNLAQTVATPFGPVRITPQGVDEIVIDANNSGQFIRVEGAPYAVRMNVYMDETGAVTTRHPTDGYDYSYISRQDRSRGSAAPEATVRAIADAMLAVGQRWMAENRPSLYRAEAQRLKNDISGLDETIRESEEQLAALRTQREDLIERERYLRSVGARKQAEAEAKTKKDGV